MPFPLSPEVKPLIDLPHFAHLATLTPDGSPQSVPVWIGRAGEHLVICTGENSLKAKSPRRDPRVALSVADFTNPYEEVQIRGRVSERRPDPEWKAMDPISHKYSGKPFPMRNPGRRVALIMEVEKVRHTKLPFERTPPK